MFFCGDVSISGRYDNAHYKFDFSDLGQSIFVNLEGAICSEIEAKKLQPQRKLYNVDKVLTLLHENHVTGCILANNHVTDFDDSGFTKKALDKIGIQSTGYGLNKQEAKKPIFFSEDGIEYSLLAFGWNVAGCKYASDTQRGVNPLEKDSVLSQIQAEHKKGKKVVAFFHWNYVYELYPLPAHRELAKMAVDAGADLIIGCHSHCTQGVEFYKGAPIVYGLGNWMFDSNVYFDGRLSSHELGLPELVIEYRNGILYCHWYQFDKELSIPKYVHSEAASCSEAIRELTPFSGMSEKDYIAWFRENRRIRKFLPLYEKIDAPIKNRLYYCYMFCREKLGRNVRNRVLNLWKAPHGGIAKEEVLSKRIRTAYIGEFPPPYGGVTVKNQMLYDYCADLCAESAHSIKAFDLLRCKTNPLLLIPLLFSISRIFMSDSSIIYGIGSMKRLYILLGLQDLFRKSPQQISVIGMGGRFSQFILKNRIWRKKLRNIRAILVETGGIKAALEREGFHNVAVFPNPKTGEGACPPGSRRPVDPLKLLYFSQISREKGVYDVMETTRILNAQAERIPFSVDFYGHIAGADRADFERFVTETENAHYCGVFDSAKDNVYRKLNGYDILLFPTRWKGEGVPGVLVEAKMAGLAVIASNHAYNAEIVREGNQEGIIIDGDFAVEMAERIKFLWENPESLSRLKEGSFRSRERYTLEHYEDMIMNLLSYTPPPADINFQFLR